MVFAWDRMWTQLWFRAGEKPPQDLPPSGGFLLRHSDGLVPDDAALFAHDPVVAVDLARNS
jgi:hypothetical protein